MEQAQKIIIYLLPAILGLMGAFHLYWAAGGKLFIDAVLPEKNGKPLFQPTPTLTSIIGASFFGFGWVILAYGGLVETTILPHNLRYGMLGILGLFFARMVGDFNYMGVLKKVKGTYFARMDDIYFIPLCGIIAIMLAVLLRK